MTTDTLKPVTVMARIRPRIKGDTLEFKTDNIVLQPNAVAEELLRRLPGLQIDANGNITFNGEPIDHLLLNGEDMFKSDAQSVARSLDAAKIGKVEIIDQKSDHAAFTGIDDGKRSKVLNLVMKTDTKDGSFGKIEGGSDVGGYYNLNGTFDDFRNNQQIAALGLSSNTGDIEFNSHAGNSSANVTYLDNNIDLLDASAGTGVPRFNAAAMHYANLWNEPHEHINVNYQFSQFYSQPVTTSKVLQIQPDSIFEQMQQNRSINSHDQNWIKAVYDRELGPNSMFMVKLQATNSIGHNQFEGIDTSAFNHTLVANGQRYIQDRAAMANISINASYRKSIGKKPNQTFFVSTEVAKSDIETNGYLYSIDHFYYPSGSFESGDTIDQRKQIMHPSCWMVSDIGLNKSVLKTLALGISYMVSTTDAEAIQSTFDRGDGKYKEIVDSLSGHYKTQTLSQQASINLQGKTKQLYYTISNGWRNYNIFQKNVLTDSTLHLRQYNWIPQVHLNYTLNSVTKFSFSYNKSIIQPTATQLQTTTNNSNPLNIVLGNPNLSPSVTHSLRLEFTYISAWTLYTSIGMSLLNNSISAKTTTDSLSRQVSQPINVNGNWGSGLNFSATTVIQGITINLHTYDSYNRAFNYVNTDLNRNDAYTLISGISISKDAMKTYTFQYNANFAYFNSHSSINTATPIHYWEQSQSLNATVFFLRNFEITIDAAYTWQQKTSAFTGNISALFLNSHVGGNFFANRLMVRFQLTNLLNQNDYTIRTNSANTNTQSAANILGRHWMLSAAWRFDRKSKHKNGK